MTSPPVIMGNVAIVGGFIYDNQSAYEPSGVVKAFDVDNGELLWAWDFLSPKGIRWDPTQADFTKNTPNFWSMGSGDEDLGLVYLPTGNTPPDFYGGHRSPEQDRYASSVVALEISSGDVKWSFQTVYHDVWDYDVPSQPVLVEWNTGTETVPALILATKRGEIFVLDRRNGQPLTDVKEQVVPQTDIPEGDMDGNVYAINRKNGAEEWQAHLNDHPDATITGSPQLYEEILYVPISSKEWATAADPSYACCTFRGGIAAFNTKDGEMIWKNFSIQETPKQTGKKNSIGADIIAPSGAPIWNSPTIDPGRGLLYVGTGESYSSPAAPTSDAVLAFSLKTGELVWHQQLLAGDAWNMSCFIGSSYNCPEEDGPDMDIGAPPILVSVGPGKDILLVGQKNGMVFGLDPAKEGEIIWKRKIGVGGYAGGVHWGMSVEGLKLFAPNADTDFIGRFDGERFPGVYALDVRTGEVIWYTRAIEDCKEDEKPACDAGVSAALTAIPGVVFAGAFDGQLRAYDSDSGKVIWSTKTNRSFDTISGRIAKGGAIEADGPVIYKGNLLINSGYHYGSRLPGNVLLNFAVPKK